MAAALVAPVAAMSLERVTPVAAMFEVFVLMLLALVAAAAALVAPVAAMFEVFVLMLLALAVAAAALVAPVAAIFDALLDMLTVLAETPEAFVLPVDAILLTLVVICVCKSPETPVTYASVAYSERSVPVNAVICIVESLNLTPPAPK